METKILGFSGKLGAGKDSVCNALHAIAFVNVLNLTKWAKVRPEDGKLIVEMEATEPDHTGQIPVYRDVFDLDKRDPEFLAWMAENVWPFIRKFSFAEPLKELCQHILGLAEESVWGTNEQKNQLTHLLWENMPGVVTPDLYEMVVANTADEYLEQMFVKVHQKGLMTAREVMEYTATEIFRKMYDNVWVDTLIRGIQLLQPQYAVVSDVRFPNEVAAIKSIGGKVIRLTRTTPESAANTHLSNVSLDVDKYDWSNFDFVLDNQELSMEECHAVLIDKLLEWEFLTTKELGKIDI